jgi:hypothetical protein
MTIWYLIAACHLTHGAGIDLLSGTIKLVATERKLKPDMVQATMRNISFFATL